MSGELISIIVPVYNVKNYIKRCLQSIVRQSYSNIQIIVVNDGTIDDSIVIAKEVVGDDTRFEFYDKINGGLSDARNFGLKYARGEFVCFIDSDDWVEPDYIKNLLLQYKLNPEIDIAMIDFDYSFDYGEKERNYKLKNIILEKNDALRLLCLGHEITNHVWNKMYRRNMFDNIKFDVGRKYEDIYIMHKLFDMARKVSCSDYTGYHYYMRNDSILHEMNPQNEMDIFIGYKQRYDFLTSKELRKIVLKYCAWSCYRVLFICQPLGMNKEDLEEANNFWYSHGEIASIGIKYFIMYRTPKIYKKIVNLRYRDKRN